LLTRWATIGTVEKQYIIAVLKDGRKFRFEVPRGSYLTPKQLQNGLYYGMLQKLDDQIKVTRKRRQAREDEGELIDPEVVAEEAEAPMHSRTKEQQERDRRVQDERRRMAEEVEQRKVEEDKRKKVEEDQRKKMEADRLKKVEEEKQKKIEEDRRKKMEADRVKKAEDDRRKKSEEEKRIKAVEDERKQAEADRQRKIMEVQEREYMDKVDRIEAERDEAEDYRRMALARAEEEAARKAHEFPKYKPSSVDSGGISYGKIASIKTIHGRDPHPLLHYLIDQDPFIFNKAGENYIKKYNLGGWDNFLEHVSSRFNEFKQIYDHELYNDDYKNKSDSEKSEILNLARGILFHYDKEIGRFVLKISDQKISHVHLSKQIGFAIGYDEGQEIFNGQYAKYAVDLHGGVSHICVYINNGLIESMIFGNTFANLLQIIAVEGQIGQIVERNYSSPLFHKVVARDMDLVDIEIRTLDGRLFYSI
jgi:hypothetical protein